MPWVETAAYAAGHAGAEFLEDWAGQDGQLATAQAYLALLEADPAADELTLVVARHDVLQRKRSVATAVADET